MSYWHVGSKVNLVTIIEVEKKKKKSKTGTHPIYKQ